MFKPPRWASLLCGLVLAAGLLLGHAVFAADNSAGRLPPVDEAAQDPSFLQFKKQLLTAVKRRDASSLLAALAPDIANNFEGEKGVEEFKNKWRPDQRGSRIWVELDALLKLGGSFKADGSFTAPYTFSKFPAELDPFEYAVVIRRDVPLRAAARNDAAIIEPLHYDIVRIVDLQAFNTKPTPRYISVRAASEKIGYVRRQDIRLPLDYRAEFERRDGRWMMTSLVAGD